MSSVPVTEATPAVTTPVHVSPTFTTYRLLSEEDIPIPTIREEEMAEGLAASMHAGMSLEDPFGSSNPTRSELEDWYR